MSPRKNAITRRLSTRLIIAFIAAIVATTTLAGVPAYWLIRAELERQVWARVSDGERITLTLIEAEKTRLFNLASHASERPTLQELIRDGEASALAAYLRSFRAGIDVDFLAVSDTADLSLIDSAADWPSVELPVAPESTFYALPDSEPRLALLVSRPVAGDLPSEVYVTAGILLDDDFTRRLAVETGLAQSVLVGGERVASSLAYAPAAVTDDVVARVSTSGQTERVTLAFPDARYYAALLPVFDLHGAMVAEIETALSIADMEATDRRALLTLIVSTTAIAAAGSGLAWLYARRLTAPITRLTGAALNISRGDLTTPVPVPEEPYEVATLAAAFEESRVSTGRFMEDLSRAKEWSETVIQSVTEGIVTIDEKGQITSFSHGAERITSWTRDEVLGVSANQVFPLVGDAGTFLEYLPLSGRTRPINVLTRQGSEMTLAVTAAQLKASDGDSGQRALVLRDITEEETARRLRSYFLANVSHEFRTPLSALNASVEWLLEEIDNLSRSEIAELLNHIHFSVMNLRTLIDNLLESASIEAGHFRIRRRPTDLNDMVAEAGLVMKPLLERRRQSLSVDAPEQLPLVQVDPTRLTQVLVNLLSNASKYSPMEAVIELSVKSMDGNSLHVAVSDRGPGIPPAERSQLFRRFVRLGAEDRTQYGIGLGLSVVKAIVEGHGGEVGVGDHPGGGSIFWFSIPLEEA